MKVLFCITLVIGLVIPGTLWAKNLALELDGETAIEVPNSDSLNPKKAITIEAWMNMSKPVGECLAKDWDGQRDYIFRTYAAPCWRGFLTSPMRVLCSVSWKSCVSPNLSRDCPKWKRLAIRSLARHKNP